MQKPWSSSGGGSVPGVSMLSDAYGQFLQFNAARKIGGMKTPFLLIMNSPYAPGEEDKRILLTPSGLKNARPI